METTTMTLADIIDKSDTYVKWNTDGFGINHCSISSNPDNIDVKEISINGEPIKDIIDRQINHYDGNRLISDEEIIELLQDKIAEKRKHERELFQERMLKSKKNSINKTINSIKKIRFDKGWTVIFWENGEVTKVKCQDGESFDPEKGVAMALLKYYSGNISYYNEIFKSLNLDSVSVEGATEIKPKKKKKLLTLFDFFDYYFN